MVKSSIITFVKVKSKQKRVKGVTPYTACPILSSIIFIHPLLSSYSFLCMCFSLFFHLKLSQIFFTVHKEKPRQH